MHWGPIGIVGGFFIEENSWADFQKYWNCRIIIVTLKLIDYSLYHNGHYTIYGYDVMLRIKIEFEDAANKKQ